MTDEQKKKLMEFIEKYDSRKYQGTYVAEAADIYAEYVMDIEHDDRAASGAEDGFIFGFIWAQELGAYYNENNK